MFIAGYVVFKWFCVRAQMSKHCYAAFCSRRGTRMMAAITRREHVSWWESELTYDGLKVNLQHFVMGMQYILGLISPMNYFPKQLLLDLDHAAEISVGKEGEENTEPENEDRGKRDKSRETGATTNWLAADGSQQRLWGALTWGQGQVWLPGTPGLSLTHIPRVTPSHVQCFHQPANKFQCHWGNLKKTHCCTTTTFSTQQWRGIKTLHYIRGQFICGFWTFQYCSLLLITD